MGNRVHLSGTARPVGTAVGSRCIDCGDSCSGVRCADCFRNYRKTHAGEPRRPAMRDGLAGPYEAPVEDRDGLGGPREPAGSSRLWYPPVPPVGGADGEKVQAVADRLMRDAHAMVTGALAVEVELPPLERLRQWRPELYAVLEECARVQLEKASDYADEDSYRNLRECERMGIPAWKGILLRLSDKWARAMRYAKRGSFAVKGEGFLDLCVDAVNYFLMCAPLYLQDREQQDDRPFQPSDLERLVRQAFAAKRAAEEAQGS